MLLQLYPPVLEPILKWKRKSSFFLRGIMHQKIASISTVAAASLTLVYTSTVHHYQLTLTFFSVMSSSAARLSLISLSGYGLALNESSSCFN